MTISAAAVASALAAPLPAQSPTYTVTHFAGTDGGAGYFDGPVSEARFSHPRKIAVDAAGNVYVTDGRNGTVRKILPGGVVTTLAGNALGDLGSTVGHGAAARFLLPEGIAVDSQGTVYVSDFSRHVIRRITPAGDVTAFAGADGLLGSVDGTGGEARFWSPAGLAIDLDDNLYVADAQNHTIRKVTPAGVVTTLAGLAGSPGSTDGAGDAARFDWPLGVSVDGAGNVVVADTNNQTIRRVSPEGLVSTIAGGAGLPGKTDGAAADARFYYPRDVAADVAGNVYVADTNANTLRLVTTGGLVITLAGVGYESGTADGAGATARFSYPEGLALGSDGNLYVADTWNDAVRRSTPAGVVTTLAGKPPIAGFDDGIGNAARFAQPSGVAVSADGFIYVADTSGHTIRRVDQAGVVTTLAGLAGSPGGADGLGSTARFRSPTGVTVDPGGDLIVADTGNHTIRRVTTAGEVTTIAGLPGTAGYADGTGSAARFSTPAGVVVGDGGTIYVADYQNHLIRAISASGEVTTLAGSPGVPGTSDGVGGAARFNQPRDLAIDAAGVLFVADYGNHTIRRVTSAGTVSTLAGSPGVYGHTDGTGTAATFKYPAAIAIDPDGNLYVADSMNTSVRKVTSAGVVSTLAGSWRDPGAVDGTGAVARFENPTGIAVNGTGDLIVADRLNYALRRCAVGLADVATVDASPAPLGLPRHLGSVPQTAEHWSWSLVRIPSGSTATLSATDVPDPTFIPDVEDLFVFRLEATGVDGDKSITLVEVQGVCEVAAPTVEVVAGENPTCTGSPVWLDAGGGYDGYLWSTGETTRAITVNPTQTTDYWVRGYAGSCASDLTHVTVVVDTPLTDVAIVAVGSTVACNGGQAGTAVATPTGGGFATYQWGIRGPSGFVTQIPGATASSYQIHGTDFPSPGTFDLVCTVTPHCGDPTVSNAISIVVSEITTPVISADGPLSFCAGGSVTLDAGDGYAAYLWNTGATSRYIAVDAPGSYSVTGSDLNGCTVTSAAVVVATSQRPDPSPSFATLTGSHDPSFDDGTGTLGGLSAPNGVAVDAAGNIFVADYWNQTIRRVSPAGAVSTLAGLEGHAGSSDGQGASARFDYPRGVAVDAAGTVFVADTFNHRIRRVAPDGVVTTYAGSTSGSADGPVSVATFSYPSAVAVDSAGNLVVADAGNYTIRRIGMDGVVTTLAGMAGQAGTADGTGSAARFSNVGDLAFDSSGNVVVADSGNHTLRRVTPAGLVTTIAGAAGVSGHADGPATEARFNYPNGVGFDSQGNLLISEHGNKTVRVLTPVGVVTTLAGAPGVSGNQDGQGSAATFLAPAGIAVEPGDSAVVIDSLDGTIRRVSVAGEVSTFVGNPRASGGADGPPGTATLGYPFGIALGQAGDGYFADSDLQVIRKVAPDGVVSTIAGLAGFPGVDDGAGAAARFASPRDVAVDPAGHVFVADTSNHTIREIRPDGTVTTLAGLGGSPGAVDGVGGAARFNFPGGVAIDRDGTVLVADTLNHTIRRVTADGLVSTVAGAAGVSGTTDGSGAAARFTAPSGLAVGADGSVFIVDHGSNTIRRLAPDGTVTTLAGSPGQTGSTDGVGSAARFDGPWHVAVDCEGNLYVADSGNSSIRKISPTGGVTTLAGWARHPGFADGTGQGARFAYPTGIAVGARGEIVVADPLNKAIRMAPPAISDEATVDLAAGPVGSARQLGTTNGSASSWRWQVIRRPGGSVALLSADDTEAPAFTPDRPGLYIFRLYAENEDGLRISTVELEATCPPAPPGITVTGGSNPTCPGSSLTLEADAGYDAYLWSTGETTRSISITPAAPMTVTVVGTIGSCTSNPGELAVEIRTPPVPVISADGPLSFCSGGSVTLDAGAGYASYLWSPGGVTTRTITVGAPGRYTVSVIDSNGCVGVSRAVWVVVSDAWPDERPSFVPLAGARSISSEDGGPTEAYFGTLHGLAVSGAGVLYVADSSNHTIRRIDTSGTATTLAGRAGVQGSADGTDATARLAYPRGLALEATGSLVVADTWNNLIRRVTATGETSTVAGGAGIAGDRDGPSSEARFSSPCGVAVSADGSIWVADTDNHTIRRIAPDGTVSTVAGYPGAQGSVDGIGMSARFDKPVDITVGSDGNLYVADQRNNTIRRVTPAGEVVTLAGLAGEAGCVDGAGNVARFDAPSAIAAVPDGSLVVVDANSDTVRRVTPEGLVSTVAGRPYVPGFMDGPVSSAKFRSPGGVAAGVDGVIYVAESGNHCVRVVTPEEAVSTRAGHPLLDGAIDSTGAAATFTRPAAAAFGPDGTLFVADGEDHTVRAVSPAGVVTTIAGLAGESGSTDGAGSDARFDTPGGIACDTLGALYVADTGNHTIRKIVDGVVTTVAGAAGQIGWSDGIGASARFYRPLGIAIGPYGELFVADQGNSTVREISPEGVVSTLAGTARASGTADGIGPAARFMFPAGIAAEPAGSLVVADALASTIRRVTRDGAVTTIAGIPGGAGSADGAASAATFYTPWGVAVDCRGDIYVADKDNSTLRKLSRGGEVSTLAGVARSPGGTPGTGAEARLLEPSGLAVSAQGDLVVADGWGRVVWRAPRAVPDEATIEAALGLTGTERQLDTAPKTATSWRWQVIRRPAGSAVSLSTNDIRNPTFTPDQPGLYIFRLYAESEDGLRISTVELTALPSRRLTVTRAGSGTGTVASDLEGIACGSTCSAAYEAGATVVLTATPTTGHHFAGWSGGCVGLGECRVTLSADIGVTATFTFDSPAAPTDLVARLEGRNSIRVYWVDHATDETGFEIERRSSRFKPWEPLASVPADTVNYLDGGFPILTVPQFYYRVRAVNAAGSSAWSNDALSGSGTVEPPVAPAGLAAFVGGPTAVDLSWADTASNEIGFRLERRTGDGPYGVIVELPAGATGYRDSGLVPATGFTYRVQAYNSFGCSAWSNEATAFTGEPGALPTAPTGLSATPRSASEVELTWIDRSDNEAGFLVQMRPVPDGAWNDLAVEAAGTTATTAGALAPSTAYGFRVRAFNASGASPWSAEAVATTQAAPVLPPSAPTGLVAAALSASRIELSWNDTSTSESAFELQMRRQAEASFAPLATVGAGTTLFVADGLEADTAFVFRVRASNVGGASAWSNEAFASTDPESAGPPAAPSDLTALVTGSAAVTLYWLDGSTTEGSFEVQRRGTFSTTWSTLATLPADTTTYLDTALSRFTVTRCTYRVRAVNADGASPWSNEASPTSGSPTPPSAPASLIAAAVSGSQIELSWADTASNEVGFRIERMAGSGVFTPVVSVGPNLSGWVDAGVAAGTTYTYRVQAYNVFGGSGWSNEASATTPSDSPTPPAAPSGLHAAPSSTSQINLAWTDNAVNEESFTIERDCSSGQFAEVATVGANVVGWSDTGLPASTSCTYRVRATNAYGASGYSNEATATTYPEGPALPAAPSGLVAVTRSSSQIDLTWVDNADDETGYVVERRTEPAGEFVQVASLSAGATSWSSTGLAPDTSYTFRVRAVNAAGPSGYSNEAAATTLPESSGVPPAAPTDLSAVQSGAGEVTLVWTDASPNESEFRLERRTGVFSAWEQIATVGEDVTTYVDSSVARGTTYKYRVSAGNAFGSSDYSNVASVTVGFVLR